MPALTSRIMCKPPTVRWSARLRTRSLEAIEFIGPMDLVLSEWEIL